MADYKIDKNTLYVGNNKIEFQNNVENVKTCNDLYIVLIDSVTINNVFAVNKNGKIVWQVEDAGKVYSFVNDSPYVGTRITDSNQIIVTNFNGVTFTVEHTMGKIVDIGVTK